MLSKKIFFLSSWLLVFLIMQVNAQVVGKENRLMLAESIKLALENNKRILQARESIGGAEAKVGEARSSSYPQMNLQLGYTRLNTFSTFRFAFPDMPPEEIKLGTPNNYNAQIALNQLLFDWGRTAKATEASELGLTMTKQNVSLIEREVSYLVANLFYQIFVMHEVVKVLDENLTVLDERYRTMKKKYDAGQISEFDLLSMEVQISSVKAQKLESETSLQKLELEFNRALGRPTDAQVYLNDSLAVHPMLEDERALIREAIENRIELKQLQHQEQMALLQKDIASTMNMPTVGAFVNWELRNAYLPNVDIFKGSWMAGLSVAFPLFDGFRTSAQISQAEVQFETIQMEYENLKQSIEIEVRQTLLDLKLGQRKMEVEKTKITQAEQALKIAEVQYEKGMLSALDLLDAHQSLKNARLNYLQAFFNYKLSRFNLKKAVGKMLLPQNDF